MASTQLADSAVGKVGALPDIMDLLQIVTHLKKII